MTVLSFFQVFANNMKFIAQTMFVIAKEIAKMNNLPKNTLLSNLKISDLISKINLKFLSKNSTFDLKCSILILMFLLGYKR